MEDAEQNKSEAPTQFKLAEARRKGSIARGMDLGFFTGLAAFTLYVWLTGPRIRAQVEQAAEAGFVSAPSVLNGRNEILALTGAVLSQAAGPILFAGAVIFVTVLVFELFQTGFIFSSTPLKPDFNKLNPAQNLKRLFTLRMLVETAKNVLKMGVYLTLCYFVLRYAVAVSAPAITNAHSLADAMAAVALRLLVLFLVAAAGFAVFDQLIVRRDYTKKMRMSRRDVRRESRDREGDPRMKSRRKQLHGEFVKLSQSLRGIRGADVLITNPTHFAVALRYDPQSMAAPKVVSQGAHQVALRLRRLAFFYGVTIVREPLLARALYRCELGKQIPESLYQPVADIYLAMRNRKSAAAGNANV